jgi:hypothetical protein
VRWLVVMLLCSCATSTKGGGVAELVVTDDSGAQLWRGPATYTVRQPQRAVGVKGVGEILVGARGDECRFAWSKDGLDRLVLFDFVGEVCAERDAQRLCFSRARFKSADGRALVVDGCADENDLLWSKIEGERLATVGPIAYRSRCARVPARRKGCDVTYIGLESIDVATNDRPRDGFNLLWDGEHWRACFLEKDSGAYRVALHVEDSCDKSGPVVLEGQSSDLDD